MKRAATVLLTLALLLAAAPSPQASPYDFALCPIVGGRFLLDQGHLWIEILQQDHKPVQPRRERITNPLDDRSHEVLSTRGPVIVEAHKDKNGGLFIHWGTLKDAKP
jgi:hypothetical protein